MFKIIFYKDENNNYHKPCSGNKAIFSGSYVSMSVEKFTINKEDSLIRQIVDSDKHVFATVTLNADYKQNKTSIVKVSNPYSLNNMENNVDIATEWQLLDRIPWYLKNAELQIKLGYEAESSIDSVISSVNSIVSASPVFTLSTAAHFGMATASGFDKLLFQQDRTVTLLNSIRQFPLQSNKLCEGYYVVFSAENNTYRKYDKNVIWDVNNLKYGNQPIDDASYAVINVRITDHYYNSTEDAFNDDNREWSKKYNEVHSKMVDLATVTDSNKLNDIESDIRNRLSEARTLLESDSDLMQKEKEDIHKYAKKRELDLIDDISKRLTPSNQVTEESTAKALSDILKSSNSNLLEDSFKDTAKAIVKNPDKNLPEFSSDLGKELNTSINNIEKVISNDRMVDQK